jgi:predicted O-methyltransferase YrrM
MWFKIKSYLHFLLTSTNQHGVHSPFVFDLICHCIYKKTPKVQLNLFKQTKKWLYLNDETITVTDFGKGSSIFKSNQRKVNDIAKVAGISTKKAGLLMRLIAYFNAKNCLEIGTSVGLGTSAMHIAHSTANITTLEGCKQTAQIAKQLFHHFNFNNINIHIGEFENTIPQVIQNETFDLVYFDGNHQKKPTLFYFNNCLKTVSNNSVFIFDDINWSNEMANTWEEIKAHPKVTVTIDLYFWGLVFFRTEQLKQHFKIRV